MTSWTDECFSEIQKGDKVWYESPQGQTFSGKAVMVGPHGWVLNTGGRHGTAKVVNEGSNYLGHRPGRGRSPDNFGHWMNRFRV